MCDYRPKEKLIEKYYNYISIEYIGFAKSTKTAFHKLGQCRNFNNCTTCISFLSDKSSHKSFGIDAQSMLHKYFHKKY